LQVRANQVRIELGGLEDLRVGLEVDGRAMAAKSPDLFELVGRFAPLERLPPFVAVAADGRDQLLRQRINDRGTDAVQAARVNVVAPLTELGTGVQRRQNQLQGRPLVFGVEINRNAAAVVDDAD